MKVYFPIPPNIKISEINDEILSSITFLNIPNNRLKSFLLRKYKDIVFLGIYHLKNKEWILLDIKECAPLQFVEIWRSDLNVTNEELVVVVPKKSRDFKKATKTLSEPDSLKIDQSVVAQRVSLNFSFCKNTTSFQGEYPFKMASLKKSSFLSFDFLKGTNQNHLKSYLILMNISKDLNTKDSVDIKIFNPNKRSKIRKITSKRNSYTVHDTTKYAKGLEEETIILTSDICSFIPIFLCLNLETKQLSVEHVHPPSEYFFGSNKEELVKALKNQWIN